MVRESMKESSLKTNLRMACIDNNYKDDGCKEFNLAMKKIRGYTDETASDWKNGLKDVKDAVEFNANLVMSTTTDITGNGRNVFMTSLHNTSKGKLNKSVFYNYIQQDNPDIYNQRIISLIGRSADKEGKTIYDYLESHCANPDDREHCKVVLLRMREAMEADKEHPVSIEIMQKYNECAKSAGLRGAELYDIESAKRKQKGISTNLPLQSNDYSR